MRLLACLDPHLITLGGTCSSPSPRTPERATPLVLFSSLLSVCFGTNFTIPNHTNTHTHTLQQPNKVDSRYHILDKAKLYLTAASAAVGSTVNSLRRDMQDGGGGAPAPSGRRQEQGQENNNWVGGRADGERDMGRGARGPGRRYR